MQKFHAVFGDTKPVIAMVHLGALPGAPLYDADAGLDGLVDGAMADLDALQAAGVDAIMFGNENDRPYEFDVDRASTATMAYVIGRLRDRITVPFGVNVLWDPQSTVALAAATGAAADFFFICYVPRGSRGVVASASLCYSCRCSCTSLLGRNFPSVLLKPLK